MSVGAEAAPLSKSGGAGLLVGAAACEAPFRVEEVVDRGAIGGKGLQTSPMPESEHGALRPSERLVRVLHPVVESAVGNQPVLGPNLFESRAVEAELIGDQLTWPAMPLYQLLQKLQRRLLVPVPGHQGFQH